MHRVRLSGHRAGDLGPVLLVSPGPGGYVDPLRPTAQDPPDEDPITGIYALASVVLGALALVLIQLVASPGVVVSFLAVVTGVLAIKAPARAGRLPIARMAGAVGTGLGLFGVWVIGEYLLT